MSGPTCACGNAARYVDDAGSLTCAICPLKVGRDSIRLSNVPDLLNWARRYVANRQPWADVGELRSVVGVDPEDDRWRVRAEPDPCPAAADDSGDLDDLDDLEIEPGEYSS